MPVDETGQRIGGGGGEAEGRNRHQRRADGKKDRHVGGADQARHDQKTAADAEETGEKADREPVADQRGEQLARRSAVEMDIRVAAIALAQEHRNADDDHHQAEQRQQQFAIDHLAKPRAAKGAENAGRGEDQRAGPFDRLRARMKEDAGKRIGADGNRTGADRDMRRGDADDIDQQRHGQNGAAGADQTERQPDQRTGGQRDQIDGGELHGPALRLRRAARGSTASRSGAAPCRRSRRRRQRPDRRRQSPKADRRPDGEPHRARRR